MIEIGLVGIPSSGKSTFFKASTLKDVDIASYPFTTLEPNTGMAYVRVKCPCRELLDKYCDQCHTGIRFVPFKLWDVAGLVPDAHKGKGRGNEFLDDLMQANALIHVLDASGRTNSQGSPTKNFDIEKNVKVLENEIVYWLLGLLEKDWKDIVHGENFVNTFENRFSGLQISEAQLERALDKMDKNPTDWVKREKMSFVQQLRKASKPIIVAANKIDITGAKGNIKNIDCIPCSAEIELALREAAQKDLIKYLPGEPRFKIIKSENKEQKKAFDFMKKFLGKHKTTGVQEILNKTVFDLLNMIVVYPVANENKYTDKKGNVLPDAHLVKKGTTAKEFAYKIHEDIGEKFIKAVNAKTERNISADHELKNNDIISIKTRN